MMLRSAGELVDVVPGLGWAVRMVTGAAGTPPAVPEPGVQPGVQRGDTPLAADARPSVRLVLEAGTEAFDRTGMRPVTRGAYSNGQCTLLANAAGSGFDLLVAFGDVLDVTARYRPSAQVRAANLALRRRFALLVGQVLLHYPVLWRAGLRGRVPLHASVFGTAMGTPLLAGPDGVGKSTVLSAALRTGAVATADNLCCCDGIQCFGVAEPLRIDGGAGPRTSHGRVARPLPNRAEALTPDRFVVLERGRRTEIDRLSAEDAARCLIAGTYAAGELRRYWTFAATLALATGRGPAHPPIEAAAAQLAGHLPCLRVRVGDGEAVSAAQICQTEGDDARA